MSIRLRKALVLGALAVRSPRSVLRARRAIRRFDAIQRTYELAAALQVIDRLRPRVVLEIGSNLGGTLYAWSTVAAADALIVTVDIPFDNATRLRPLRHLVRAWQRIEHVAGDSHAASTLAGVRGRLAGRAVDLLFVDGDHSAEGVASDLRMYGPLVRDGGIIGFHDIVRNPAIPEHEVWKLWDELRTLRGAVEIADPDARLDGGMGIGLITVTEQLRNQRAWQTH